MWFVKYGEEYLHDPRVGLILPTAKIETELNASDYFKFTIAGNAEMAHSLKEHDQENLVTVLSDDVVIFRGEITNISSDFQTTKTVECRGELAYLNDTLVRPYSTLAGESSRTAPSSVDGYFAFLIEEHNSQVDAQKRFTIDINEGAALDKNNYIYRSDTTYPTVGKTIKEKLIESPGGYLQVDYSRKTPHISLLADFPKVNAQVIDFGINLLDFTEEVNSSDMATFVVPIGKELEQENASDSDVKQQSVKLTIAGESDGKLEDGYFKSGDIIYSEEGVKRYGWIGAVVEYSDVTIASNLVSKGLLALKGLESPDTTIKVKAIDLSMIKPDYEPITIGQYVRVRSKPHGFDSYMLCSKVDYDLNSPDNDTFTLGTTFDTITGQQNKRINALNATINTVYEAADKISAEAKAAAIIAGQAQDTATEAKNTADAANTTAGAADLKASDAHTKAEEAQTKANTAISNAKSAADAAAAAKKEAAEATASVNVIQSKVTTIEGNTSKAIADAAAAAEAAEAAQSAADAAQAKADEAYTNAGNVASQVSNINNEITGIKSDATDLRNDLESQIETVTNTMTADYAKKTDLSSVESSLKTEISTSAAGVKTEVSQTYAKKTEVSGLKDEVENNYSTKSEVQQLSDQVSSTVSAVESVTVTANAAKQAASDANTAASNAQKAADNAKTAAATAQSKADQAAADLATAESNLADLQSQADATDEQVAAAKTAVANAKKAADDAQIAADTAKSNAETAQATANAAKTAAENAQADVDALENRVSTAETSITQNADAIALRATKTEITNAISNVSIGGRNLLINTSNSITHEGTGTTNQTKFLYDFSAYYAAIPTVAEKEIILSFEWETTATSGTFLVQLNNEPWTQLCEAITVSPSNQSGKVVCTTRANSGFDTGSYWGVQVRTDNLTGTVTIKNMMLENGNKPSSWQPAPEDMLSSDEAAEIYTTQTEFTQTSDEIRIDFNKSIAAASSDLQSQMDASATSANGKFAEINKYIRFVDGKIVLGETGNELMLTVQNDRVSFTQSGVEVAYFSNNNLYVKRAEILTTMKIGNYEFTPRNDGGLALRKRSE